MDLTKVDPRELDEIGHAALDHIRKSTSNISDNDIDQAALNSAIALGIVCAFAERDVLSYGIKDTDEFVTHIMSQLQGMLKSHLDFLRVNSKDDVLH